LRFGYFGGVLAESGRTGKRLMKLAMSLFRIGNTSPEQPVGEGLPELTFKVA
jgi:hypothetical protein